MSITILGVSSLVGCTSNDFTFIYFSRDEKVESILILLFLIASQTNPLLGNRRTKVATDKSLKIIHYLMFHENSVQQLPFLSIHGNVLNHTRSKPSSMSSHKGERTGHVSDKTIRTFLLQPPFKSFLTHRTPFGK
jgi:hypothetical protein